MALRMAATRINNFKLYYISNEQVCDASSQQNTGFSSANNMLPRFIRTNINNNTNY